MIPKDAPEVIKTSRLADAEAQLQKLLYSAPSKQARDDLFSRMTEVGAQPNVRLYNQLIARAPRYAAAIELYEGMRRVNLEPDVFTYSIIINLSPDHATAKSWFEAMVKAGVQPDEVTYSTLINLSPDHATAKSWFEAMVKAGVQPNEVTYNTLINLSPDYATAKSWFEAMVKAGVQPGEYTASALTKSTATREQAERLNDKLLELQIFLGDAYYTTLYGKLAPYLTAEELLAFHVRQKYRSSAAIGTAIRAFEANKRITDALRASLAFPFVEAARRVFRKHEDAAVTYFSGLLAKDFERHNCTYALGYCYYENGRHSEAQEFFRKALALSTQEPRIEDIQKRIAEIKKFTTVT